jgi:putative DNA-invertase from lambdoid prophage Rac
MNGGEHIGYIKVYIRDQDAEKQVHELEKSGIVCNKIFVDKYVSGEVLAFDRPVFRDMVGYIKTNNVSMLYVLEFSQLGRSFVDALETVRRLEEEFNVIVWSLSPKEIWTQTTDQLVRTLMSSIFSWVIELERKNLSERTKAGVARARSEGKHIGHPFREINWKKVDEYREKGISWSTISRILDIPYSTLIRARNRRFRDTYLE